MANADGAESNGDTGQGTGPSVRATVRQFLALERDVLVLSASASR